jgi:hypothetical protein
MMNSWRLFSSMFLALAIAGCDGGTDDDNTDDGQNDAGTLPCLEPNFTSIYEGRLSDTMTCAGSGCHDAATAGGGQNYTLSKADVHATLLGDTVNTIGAPMWPKRVVAGSPDDSFFWIKLSRNDAPLGRMPLAMPPLQQCDLDAIETWIMNGAAND